MAKAKSTTTAHKKPLSLPLEEYKKTAMTLRAINHKVRQQILSVIHDNGEIASGAIYRKLKLEQAFTSAHLALLRKAGVVLTRREGQNIYYSINHEHIEVMTRGCKVING